MGLSVTKINSCLLCSSVLDFVVVLAASLDIDCLYTYFIIGVNCLFIEFVNMTYKI